MNVAPSVGLCSDVISVLELSRASTAGSLCIAALPDLKINWWRGRESTVVIELDRRLRFLHRSCGCTFSAFVFAGEWSYSVFSSVRRCSSCCLLMLFGFFFVEAAIQA